jgi:hypothetical protein
MTAIQWYYARGQQQCGPVSSSELKRLADQGELAPDALVWREGIKEWIPARSVRGLFEGEGALPKAAPLSEAPSPPEPPPVRTPFATFEHSTAAFQRSREGGSSHLFDSLLAAARTWFPPQFVESAARLFAWTGHYGLYLAMVLVPAFDVAMAVQTKQVYPALPALVEVVGLAVFQYAARRFLAACERLNRASAAKMGSSALPDCVAIFFALAGVAILIALTILAIHAKSFWSISTAVLGFIACEYLAVAAMNPETLNLSIAAEVKVDEEFLGLFSFVLKLGLRLAPVGFGVGVAWGMIDLVHAWVQPGTPTAIAKPAPGLGPGRPTAAGLDDLMKDLSKELHLDVQGAAGLSSLAAVPTVLAGAFAKVALFVAAALPIYVYFGFLFLHFLIDVNYAILSIPIKLDRLRHEEANDEGESQ